MRPELTDESIFRHVSLLVGAGVPEVRRAVTSFFDAVLSEAKSLPFDDPKKIFLRDKFGEYGSVTMIPHIGRIGPSYSRYLRWRSNEAASSGQMPLDRLRGKLTGEKLDALAERALAGWKVDRSDIRKARRHTGRYDKVWLIGKEGRRQARQAIPKDNFN